MNDTEKTARFVQLLAAHERQLTSYVLSLIPNFTDADDVLQTAKLRLWNRFEEYDAEKSFGAWARTVVYYEVLTYRKNRGRSKVLFSTELVSSLADELTDRGNEINDRSRELEFCLKRLNQKYQKLLREFYSRTSTLDGVAEAVGMTVVAARKALFRSRLAIRDCIERRLRQEGA